MVFQPTSVKPASSNGAAAILECGVSAPLFIAAGPLSLDQVALGVRETKAAAPRTKAGLTHRTPKCGLDGDEKSPDDLAGFDWRRKVRETFDGRGDNWGNTINFSTSKSTPRVCGGVASRGGLSATEPTATQAAKSVG